MRKHKRYRCPVKGCENEMAERSKTCRRCMYAKRRHCGSGEKTEPEGAWDIKLGKQRLMMKL